MTTRKKNFVFKCGHFSRNDIKTHYWPYPASSYRLCSTEEEKKNEEAVCVSQQLTTIASRCEDAENRMRRSNFLFFGIEEKSDEDWAMSEEKIISFCSEQLELNITGRQFERVHRLGKYSPEKRKPVIAKLTYIKDKALILASGPKLKGTDFAIREDFSLAKRKARTKLIKFARQQKQKYNLSVDKLRMGSKTYIYNVTADAVMLLVQ